MKKPSRHKKYGMMLVKRTFKLYSSREKWVSVFFLLLFIVSGWKIATGNWNGRNFTTIVTGGHNYNEGMVGEILHLNPVYADLNDVDRDVTSLIFEGLAKYDPKQQKVVDNIATHTLDESQTLYTFDLKPGLTWHDGEPLTASDVYFTYHDVIQHPEFENPILKKSFSGVSIEQIDEDTITMKLNAPNSFFFTQLTVGLLPKHILGEVPIADIDTHEFNQKPIGNGPYKVKRAYERLKDGSTEVALEYDKNYWKKAKPDITEINIYSFASFKDLKKARSQLHGIARVPQYLLEDLGEPRFKENPYYLSQYTALFMDTDHDELIKRSIRLGIQKSIDKQAIIEAIGYNRAIDTPLLELNQEDWINQPNAEEAAGAFFDSGWSLDKEAGKRVNKEGDKFLSFTLVRRSFTDDRLEEITRQTADMIKAQLEALGVMVTIKSYENTQFQKKVAERDYDLLLYGQSLGYNLDTYSYWHSSQINTGLNLSNYGNPKADFYIEAIRNTFSEDAEKKSEYLENLAEIIQSDIPAVFLYAPTYYILTDQRIENVNTLHLLFPHDRFANILEWKII